jgi:hypothetical protein
VSILVSLSPKDSIIRTYSFDFSFHSLYLVAHRFERKLSSDFRSSYYSKDGLIVNLLKLCLFVYFYVSLNFLSTE